jgi:hypothetical protein
VTRAEVELERFATAMWDFSWATRRFGSEAEYADWDRVLDELAERGYDNVRIDAFPHLVAADERGVLADGFVILPQRRRFMWGNHRSVEIQPREDLIEFISKCKEREISIGLSSWFIADSRHLREGVRTPDDFFRVWNETLALIDSAGLIDRILWVDLCNEFPLDVWAWGAAPEIFGNRRRTLAGVGTRALPWNEATSRRVQLYLSKPISRLRETWPQLRFCYSLCGVVGSKMRLLDVSNFGVAEVHCWLADDLRWSFSTMQLASLLELPLGTQVHSALAGRASAEKLQRWREQKLVPIMEIWSRWAHERDLPLITTEGWGPINYADGTRREESDWKWVKDFAALAVESALELGWTGICTSNFCQPHHSGMWSDVQWHRELTSAIRKTARRPTSRCSGPSTARSN